MAAASRVAKTNVCLEALIPHDQPAVVESRGDGAMTTPRCARAMGKEKPAFRRSLLQSAGSPAIRLLKSAFRVTNLRFLRAAGMTRWQRRSLCERAAKENPPFGGFSSKALDPRMTNLRLLRAAGMTQ
jgi:hypothetical protein